jgi:regulation of enolase protein 1 (concanavalin A-like superfamily)
MFPVKFIRLTFMYLVLCTAVFSSVLSSEENKSDASNALAAHVSKVSYQVPAITEVPSGLVRKTKLSTIYIPTQYLYIKEYRVHIFGSPSVSKWMMQQSYILIKEMIGAIKLQSHRDKFAGHEAYLITDVDPDILSMGGLPGQRNTGDIGHSLFNESLVCRTAVDTMKPFELPMARGWDTPVHEFGHAIENTIGIDGATRQAHANVFENDPNALAEHFAWSTEFWFLSPDRRAQFDGYLGAKKFMAAIFSEENTWFPDNTPRVNLPPTLYLTAASTEAKVGQEIEFTAGSTDAHGNMLSIKIISKGSSPKKIIISDNTSNKFKMSWTTSGKYIIQAMATSSNRLTASSSVISVNIKPAILDLEIKSHPVGQTVIAGLPATFEIRATGTPPFTFQWQKDGWDILGATDSRYTIPSTVEADNGSTYRCVVENSLDYVISNPATLTVNPVPLAAPIITTQPLDETVMAGMPATFTITATGEPAPTFQWQRDNVDIKGETAATYTTRLLMVGTSTYRCVVTNRLGRKVSRSATLTIVPATRAPIITTQPTDVTVPVGQVATFTVDTYGIPAPTLQWMRNGRDIVGATAASYTSPSVALSDSGSTYSCVAKNSAGTVISYAAKLTVDAWSHSDAWFHSDIGSVAATGSSRFVNGIWTVKGSGADIWGKEDAFHFVWQRVTGDVRITARVDSLTDTNPWSKAGVMIRRSSAANTRNVFTFVTPDRGVGFQRRVTASEVTTYTAGSNQHAPYWVRLERIGDTLIGSSSLDGQNWKEMVSDTISFGDTILVGLAVTSHSDGELATATFSNVELTTIPAASN